MLSTVRSAVRALMTALALSLLALPAAGETLPAPNGRVILEVSGTIANTNAPGKARFDREALEAIATTTLSTSTPWTKGVQTFEGFPLAALLEIVGATGTSLKAVALNDYSAVVPIDDSVAAGAFVAVRANGERMSVRERGPLWIVFPYDADSRLTTDTYLNRSVWQLKALIVE